MAYVRFHNILRERASKVIDEHRAALCGGLAQDYAVYREEVGYIRGLIDALTLCEEIEEDLSK